MFDAIRFFEDYNIIYATHGKNISKNFIGINCPECGDDVDFHCGVSKDGTFASCWRCGPKSIPYLVQMLLSCSKAESINIIKEYEGTSSHKYKYTEKEEKVSTVSKIILPGTELGKAHRKYLESRGFDPDLLIRKYGLLGTGACCYYGEQDFSYSIIIPVYDKRGRLISFQGRDYTGKSDLRYKGLTVEESIKHYKETLYNLNNVTSDTVVLVEGVFDAWRGGDNFVASFGTSLKPSQLRELAEYRRVFVLFDSEDAAQEKAMNYCKELACWGIDVENISLDMGDRDVGDLSEDEVLDLRVELGII